MLWERCVLNATCIDTRGGIKGHWYQGSCTEGEMAKLSLKALVQFRQIKKKGTLQIKEIKQKQRRNNHLCRLPRSELLEYKIGSQKK